MQTDVGAVPGNAAHGVKIVFAGSDGEARTLYYFSTNLADDGVKSSNFLKFCETLAPGDSLVKSASYLLHSGGFSKVRDFLLANSAVMVQDDSGIPLSYYDPEEMGPAAVRPVSRPDRHLSRQVSAEICRRSSGRGPSDRFRYRLPTPVERVQSADCRKEAAGNAESNDDRKIA